MDFNNFRTEMAEQLTAALTHRTIIEILEAEMETDRSREGIRATAKLLEQSFKDGTKPDEDVAIALCVDILNRVSLRFENVETDI